MDANNTGAAPSAGAAAAPAYVSSTEGLSDTQAAAMAFVDANRAEIAKGTANYQLLQKNREALDHAVRGAKVPAWLAKPQAQPQQSANAAPVEPQDHDALEQSLTTLLREPMTSDQIADFRASGTVRGLHADVSSTVADFVDELSIPAPIAKTLLDRALQHYGAEFDRAPLSAAEAFRPLTAEEARDFHNEAARLCGGVEKLEQLVQDVRDLLGKRGLLTELDRRGWTKTSLSLDPRFLQGLRLWLSTSR